MDGRGAIILGASGSGKSGLALELIALGATLVADDRTIIDHKDTQLIADAPPAILGMIEARGIGILHMDAAGPTPLALVVDLSREEDARLPQPHTCALAGFTLPCLYRADVPHFAASVLLYLRCSIKLRP